MKGAILSQASLTDPNRRAIHETHQGLRKVNKCVNKPDLCVNLNCFAISNKLTKLGRCDRHTKDGLIIGLLGLLGLLGVQDC